MTAPTHLWQFGASELAALVRTRQASCTEIVESHLDRIAAVNPLVNAVVVVLAEEAGAQARRADCLVADGADLPPLHGVPFTVKENLDVVGTATTHGLAALQGAFPDRVAPVVERLRAAGGIVLGRTNMPSFGVRWHCDSELWGATRNPWDPTRTPGASSAGEAAAVAVGMSPMGLGNDGLGSLRHPAQCCGVTALKPTLGRVPHAGSVGPSDAVPIGVQLSAVDGPIARRVADLRALLEVLAGPSWRDPWSVPAPLHGPRPPGRVRVALVPDPAGLGTAPPVRDGVLRAGAVLAGAGYDVEEVDPPDVDAAAEALLVMLSSPGVRAAWADRSAHLPVAVQQFMAAFFTVAGHPDAAAAEQAFMTRQDLLRRWGQFQVDLPLVVAPVATDIPARVGTDLSDVGGTVRSMRMVLAVSALGLPAVAVPIGVVDGLPQSVQIVGPPYREDLCLDAAAALEERLGVLTPIEPRMQA